MNEILRNIALVAGTIYLVYRIYSSYIRPFINPRHAKSEPLEVSPKQTKPPVAPHHSFQDST